MAELGTRLKEARMAKGYSLEDLQEITKIQKRYLSAIEEGNFSVMPGAFYVRAFIKQYAEAVGLDANEILETYKSEIPANKAAEAAGTVSTAIQQPKGGTNQRTAQPAAKIKQTAKPQRKMTDLMPKIAVAVVVIVVIAVIWFLANHQSKNNDVTDDVKQEQKANTSTENKVDTTKEQEVKDQEAEEKAAKKEAAAKKKAAKEKAAKEKAAKEKKKAGKLSKGTDAGDGATTKYTLANTKNFKVRVEMTGENWVGITTAAGANLVTGKMYSSGQKLEYDAKDQESIRIRLGAASAGKVFINNKEVKLVVPASSRPTQNIVIEMK